MDKALADYLEKNKWLFCKITESETGVMAEVCFDIFCTNPQSVCKILGEMMQLFNACWLGTREHTIFVPLSLEKSCAQNLSPVDKEILKLKNHFNAKLSPQELQKSIEFLIKNGLSPDEIAKKAGASIATIYRLRKKSFPLEPSQTSDNKTTAF